MLRTLCRFAVGCVVVCASAVVAQAPAFPSGERADADAALNRALKISSLTFDGKPFHAVVEIGKPGEEYSGRVEVWWAAPKMYKLQIGSPRFSEQKIVNGDRIWEKDEGDYYPRWLENFVLAVLNPVPVERNFRGRGGEVMLGENMSGCLQRDDRPGGITDQMTWGMICFKGSEPRLESVLTTNVNITFEDWKKFEKKDIARTIKTDVEGFEEVAGRMTSLDELTNPDPAMFEVKEVTPPEQRIATEYVSTLTEEGMVEVKPNIQWPSVREGKTDGYMIVYARTDRKGQVRETAKHNSDQPGLEDFGMKTALGYKFKPLVVNGVPVQMEMPLVLHFTSKLEDTLPILSVDQMKKQIIHCDAGVVLAGTPRGATITFQISVNEAGKITGLSGPRGSFGTGDQTMWRPTVAHILQTCKLAPYVSNGKVTYYKGDVELKAP